MKCKKFISAFLALIMIFSVNTIASASGELLKIPNVFKNIFSVGASAVDSSISAYAPAGTRDLALDATPTASSSYEPADGGFSLKKLIDGQPGSGTNGGFSTSPDENSAKTDPAWIVLDLEGYYDISKVVLFPYGAFPDTFTIQVSSNGKDYTTVDTVTGKTGNNQILAENVSGTKVRYVKIDITLRGSLDGNTMYYVQLGEIAVFGSETQLTPSGTDIDSYTPANCVNLAYGAKASADSSYESSDSMWSINHLNDADAVNNGFSTVDVATATADTPLNITYDLGTYANIKRVVLFPHGIFPSNFEIQISDDGINYRTVKTVTGCLNSQSILTQDLDGNIFASYLRIHITKRNRTDIEGYYVQFGEIAVYGIKNPITVTLNKTDLLMQKGESEQITYTCKVKSFYSANQSFAWATSNSSVATVSDGLITAAGEGSTNVTLTEQTINAVFNVKVKVQNTVSQTNDKLTIAAFFPPTGSLMTDAQYQLMEDAGIDLLFNSFMVPSVSGNKQLAAMAAKHNMKILVGDSRLASYTASDTSDTSVAKAVVSDYSGVNGVAGFYLKDEPKNPNIYAKIYNDLKNYGSRYNVHLNFLPSYVYQSDTQYEFQMDDWANLTGSQDYLMFDIYPFLQDGTTWYQKMLGNLNAMRKSGLKNSTDTAACIQTLGYGSISSETYHARIPDEGEIRYQDMASLAYGVKELAYFTWCTPTSSTERFSDAVIDSNGNTTERYNYIKNINSDVHNLGKTLINLDSQEVYLSGSSTYGQSTLPSNFFAQTTSTDSLIFSYMTDRTTGKKYLMLVNNNFDQAVSVPLSFASGISTISVLNNSTGVWTSRSASGYTASIAAGDGMLIGFSDENSYSGATAAESSNLALGATVHGTSSVGENGWYLSCLTDGYTAANSTLGLSGWCSSLKDASYETSVQLDMGKAKTMNNITLYAADSSTGYTGYFPKAYTVSVSADGSNWTQVAAETAASVSDSVSYSFTPAQVRYIKMDITQMNNVDGKYAAAVGEIEAYSNTKITRYKTVPNGADGYYVYAYCINAATVKFPTWTQANGQDDLIWYVAESGSWNINGLAYNYRYLVPVSDHNNEHGHYITHIYSYAADSTFVAIATSYDFNTDVIFNVNHDSISPNIIMDLSKCTSSSGLSLSYDLSDDSLTLNGTLTASCMIQTINPISVAVKKGDTIRFTVDKISGTAENLFFSFDLLNDAGGSPCSIRQFRDVFAGNSAEIYIDSDALANEINNYRIWCYYQGGTVTQTATNFKVRLKIEVKGNVETLASPSGFSKEYGSTYGTLPTVQSDNGNFLGWFTQPDGGTQITSSSTVESAGLQTLYAHWQLIEPTYYTGLVPCLTAEKFESDYLKVNNSTVTYSKRMSDKYLGTGTEVCVRSSDTDNITARYIIIIFGDVNGDGLYDAQDAVIVHVLSSGLLTESTIGAPAYYAADCNHSGTVDDNDALLLEQAGVYLETVNQSGSQSSAKTASAWSSYVSLVDQSADVQDNEEHQSTEPLYKRIFKAVYYIIMRWLESVIIWN